ncbi:MAG TPA: hypothetical protein VNO52_08240, partial [Methylomirabilota bacterium]|nr:hypothetical protein [Methylomirabilota bacterium]
SEDDLDGFDDDRVLLPNDGRDHYVTFVAYVENDCEIDLVNVTITDPVLAQLGCTNFPAPFSLKAGESASFELCVREVNCQSLPLTNRLMVTAEVDTSGGICGTHQDGGVITVKCQSTAVVQCQKARALCVTKEVACYTGGQCGTYGDVAMAIKTDAANPQFCYRITVANCGVETMNRIRVTDSHLGNITGQIMRGRTTLLPGESVTGTIVATVPISTTNTVTVKGVSQTGITITKTDTAVALVKESSLTCAEFVISRDDLDGFDDDHVLLANDGTTGRTVKYIAYVENDCEIDLVNVTITDPVLAQLGCTNFPAPFSLKAGESASFELCVYPVGCESLPLTTRLIATADVDTKNGALCVAGSPRVTCEALATVECTRALIPGSAGVGVRVQSTGVLKPKFTHAPVRAALHSGVVEGPMGIPGQWDAFSSCITGQWQHTRLAKGGVRGQFEATLFDSLMVACLPCKGDTNTPVIAGTLCLGPDDCGRDPRKAAGSKACFSGVGTYQLTQARGRDVEPGEVRTVLFRVDLEDRTEPKAGKKNAVGERYRIRIWILTAEELARFNNPADGLADIRAKIACTPESAAIEDGAAGGLGSAVMGVRAPDIDDGGPLSGNNQVKEANLTGCQ